jgi:hypothetical protein
MELFRARPLGFGVWGASLLGTLPDRTLLSDNLLVGTGEVEGRDKISLISLVPTGRNCELPSLNLANEKKKPIGIIVKIRGTDPSFRKWAFSQFNGRIVEVTLPSMTSSETLNYGIAAEVLQIASRSAAW